MVHMQYTVEWTVPGAGETVSVFNMAPQSDLTLQSAAVAAIRTFFASLTASLPNEVTINFPTEMKHIDTVSGVLSSITSVTSPASVTGTGAGQWVGGAGALIQWETGAIVAGRRLRGRTFWVPAPISAFDTDGTPSETFRSGLATKAGTLLTDLQSAGTALWVWSRTHGVAHAATTASVPNRSAILRGRRDP